MKLDIECVRDVLLEFENLPIGNFNVYSFPNSVKKHGPKNVLYTLVKLSEANYVNARIERTMDGTPHIHSLYDITFDGHQFLDTIRENQVWNKTKDIVGKVGSSSFKIISQIATAILTDLASAYIKSQI